MQKEKEIHKRLIRPIGKVHDFFMAWKGRAWQSLAERGMARLGMAWCGVAWLGLKLKEQHE